MVRILWHHTNAKGEWRTMPVDEWSGDERLWKRAEACVIESARQGDARAFALLWMRFEPRLAAFTRRMCRHYHLSRSDDAWGEVYLEVARSMTTFDPVRSQNPDGGAAFCSWAYRIAARVVVDHAVRGRRVATVEVSVEDWDVLPVDTIQLAAAALEPAEHLALRETVGRIYERIENDDNADRASYLWLIAEGESQQDAASAIGVNPSTGRSWLKRFRLDLEAEQDADAKTAAGAPKKRGQKNA